MKKSPKEIFNRIANNTSLSKKYIYSNVLLVFIPCIILATAFFLKFQKTVQTEINSSYEQVMDQYIANANYKLNLYHNIEKAFAVNSVVQEILMEDNVEGPMDIMRLIDKFTRETKSIFLDENQMEVYNITLYSYNDKLYYDGELLRNLKYATEEEWYIEILNTRNFYNCFYKTKSLDGQNLLLLSYPIIKTTQSGNGNFLGYIQISLYSNRIFRPESGMPRKKGMEVLILDKKGNVVYGDAAIAGSMQGLLKENKKSGVIRNGETDKIYICKSLSPYSLDAIAFFPYNEVNSKVGALAIFSIIIVAAILFLSLSLTVLFSHIFTKRIHLLTGKMKRVEAGDLNITSVIEGEDEVGLLDRQFNSMTYRLKNVISENYIQRLEKREAELSALQLQINPHFLYNTLESISAIAAINNCFDICSISQKLGDMFRYNINSIKNEFVSLYDEINHIKNYVYIQEIRFEDRFEVQYNIPETLMNCKILKFILQPIVENALNHGLEGKLEKGRISICAQVNGNILYLAVEDDGQGMPPEQVKKLNMFLSETDSNTKEYIKRSIGLKNVNSRIKMVNGNAYGITVKSQLNAGTLVTIALPYCPENQEDAYV